MAHIVIAVPPSDGETFISANVTADDLAVWGLSHGLS